MNKQIVLIASGDRYHKGTTDDLIQKFDRWELPCGTQFPEENKPREVVKREVEGVFQPCAKCFDVDTEFEDRKQRNADRVRKARNKLQQLAGYTNLMAVDNRFEGLDEAQNLLRQVQSLLDKVERFREEELVDREREFDHAE